MTTYETVKVNDIDIFYREAGVKNSPAIILLHGFPTSSHMFRTLMPMLEDEFYLVAPDYPGYGSSSMPAVDEFEYSFDNLANVVDQFLDVLGLKKYSLYVFDYGAPIGFRIASRHPERIQALIVQNGNAYEEGLRNFWVPLKAYWKERGKQNEEALRKLLSIESTKWQYTNGVRDVKKISPDNWNMDQFFLDRNGNDEIQLELFYSYGSNPPLYPKWQEYFRKYQPPTLITWGKNDYIFPEEGAKPYERDLRNLELHLLDTGHFALEEDGQLVAGHIRRFMGDKVLKKRAA